MIEHGLVTFVVLTLAATALITFWRKVLLLLLSVAIAVFALGLLCVAELIHV